MAKYTDNVVFNNVKDSGTNISSTPISRSNNYTYNDAETEITGINSKVVNCVDIDWNGAVLPNGDIANGSSKTINTTGELLKLINDMSSQISTLNEQVYALGAAVIAIGSKVSN